MTKKMLMALSLVVLVTFSGCTAKSFNAMEKDKKVNKRTVVVKQNYQTLYKRSLSMAEECHTRGMITAAIIADGQLYTKDKSAEISIYLMGGLGKQMYHGAKLKAIDENSTSMTIYSYPGGEWLDILEAEFVGDCKNCFCEDELKTES